MTPTLHWKYYLQRNWCHILKWRDYMKSSGDPDKPDHPPTQHSVRWWCLSMVDTWKQPPHYVSPIKQPALTWCGQHWQTYSPKPLVWSLKPASGRLILPVVPNVTFELDYESLKIHMGTQQPPQRSKEKFKEKEMWQVFGPWLALPSSQSIQ